MSQIDTETGEIKAFEPSRFLRKISGKDYLEVKWRLLWIRSEHPDAILRTELVKLEPDFALFKATVSIPGRGEATGYGSETRGDFGEFIEKAETKALGRALAALGFGTQFCDDYDFAAGAPEGRDKVVDSPVDRPAGGSPYGGSSLATPAQLKLIYLTAIRDLHITEEELEDRCQAQYGRLPLHLTKREASEFIDSLKAAPATPAPAQPAAPDQPTAHAQAAQAMDAAQQNGQAADLEEWATDFLARVSLSEPTGWDEKQAIKEFGKAADRTKGRISATEMRPLLCALHLQQTGEVTTPIEVTSVLDLRIVRAIQQASTTDLLAFKRLAQDWMEQAAAQQKAEAQP